MLHFQDDIHFPPTINLLFFVDGDTRLTADEASNRIFTHNEANAANIRNCGSLRKNDHDHFLK